jgi:hypothetical protein
MRLFNHFADWSEAVRTAVQLTVGRNIETYIVLDRVTSPHFAVYEEDHASDYADEMFLGGSCRLLDATPIEHEQVPGLLVVARGGEVVEQFDAPRAQPKRFRVAA